MLESRSRKLLVTVIGEMVKLPHVKGDALRIQRDTAEAIAESDSDRAREVAIEHMKHVHDVLDTREHSEAGG